MTDSDATLSSCVDHVTSLYARTTEQLLTMNVGFEMLTHDGSVPLHGPDIVLSLSDVGAVRLSIQWALESWTGSGKLPDVEQLYSYVLNSGGSPVAIICTLSLMAQAGGILALLGGGHVDMVSRELEALNRTEEPVPTSQNTSQKSPPAPANGLSTEDWTALGRKRGSLLTKPVSAATKRKTKKGLRLKRKRKASTRKGLKQKGTKK